MTVDDGALVVGLAGAFGSGCTTLAEALAEDLGFTNLKLSDLIRREWHEREFATSGGEVEPPRGALQDLGDARRRFHGKNHYWVESAIASIDRRSGEHPKIVLDGIRNPGEVSWLRESFKNFVLVAVDAPRSERWERLRNTKNWADRTQAEFDEVSRRDVDSPVEWGQRVQACVDNADYIITNDHHLAVPAARAHLLDRASRLLRLMTSPSSDQDMRPTEAEVFMHLAHAAASRSACLKRQVGAVVVSGRHEVDALSIQSPAIGLGFNENPEGMRPCYLEFRECYRDIWRRERLEAMELRNCPSCGSPLAAPRYPPVCSNPACEAGRNLLNVVFPERAMSHCTAIHAEVRAILSADRAELPGSTLYSTTFPCFLCAQQIINAGIGRVVYVEPYPDTAAERLLLEASIEIERFEGVRSTAYNRFFGGWRERAEREFSTRRS